MNEQSPVKIIIVDDHPVVLEGFSLMLQRIKNIQLEGKFTDAESALSYLKSHRIDIVLLDINLPDMNGIHACEAIKKKYPAICVIAISNSNEYSIMRRMLDAGALGYLLKNASAEEVVSCIDLVLQGKQGFSAGVQAILEQHDQGEVPTITRREREILKLLASGRSSIEIGEMMFISPLTVESHRRNLLQKFNVPNVASLVYKATEMKFI